MRYRGGGLAQARERGCRQEWGWWPFPEKTALQLVSRVGSERKAGGSCGVHSAGDVVLWVAVGALQWGACPQD